MSESQNISQSILEKLAPDYRQFLEANPPQTRPLHGLAWSPVFRQPPPGGLPDTGAMSPTPVGSQRVIELGDFSIQVMTPEGEKPDQGWPVVLYAHGGGWVFGAAAMDNGFLSRLCVGKFNFFEHWMSLIAGWVSTCSGKLRDCFSRISTRTRTSIPRWTR